MRQWILNAATVVATIAAVAISGVRLREEFAARRAAKPFEPRVVANWRDYAKDGHYLGRKGAPVTIIEFADYQCPFCQKAAPAIRAIRQRYPNDVAVVFRQFPLGNHQFAEAAAQAAECAGLQGRFETFHDTLFAQPDSLGTKAWTRFASDAGVTNLDDFARCFGGMGERAALVRDKAAGSELGVGATPTFIVNGYMFAGFPGLDSLNGYVASALAKAK